MKMCVCLSLLFAIALSVVLALSPVSASAAGTSTVAGTYTIADLGQGVWGGGAVMADGSITGSVAFSAGNGQYIFKLQGTQWNFTDSSDQMVNLCFNVVVIKGSTIFPPSFCFPVPVTTTPVVVPGPDGHGILIRVTLNH
ncbi:MAG TPA: hypothetical protein VH186_21215 [Chloroflexia bacterium]|nr:hypothetical protein [Chloroflexia bacterium]